MATRSDAIDGQRGRVAFLDTCELWIRVGTLQGIEPHSQKANNLPRGGAEGERLSR